MKYISFGYNCSIAAYLRKTNLIKIDSCFDNLITRKLSKITNLIKYNNNQNWFIDASLKEDRKRWHVMCNNFETFSIHDVPIQVKKEEVISYLNELKKNQLNEIIEIIKKEKEKIIILRSNESSTKLEEIFDFYNEIKKIRKNKFLLCVFQENMHHKYDTKYMKMFNIKLPVYNDKFWIYDQDWIFIFKSFLNKIL